MAKTDSPVKGFLSFILKEHFEEHVEKYIKLLYIYRLPLLNQVAHLTPEQLRARVRENQIRLLQGLEKGNAVEDAASRIKEWEQNVSDGVGRLVVLPEDLVLMHHANRLSLQSFIPLYTSSAQRAVSIVEQLEEYYTQVQKNSVVALFNAQKHNEENIRAHELELEKQNAILKQTQLLAEIGSFEWDLTSGKVVASDELNRIMDWDKRAIHKYSTPLPTVHPDDKERVRSAIDTAIAQAGSFDVYCQVTTEKGRKKIVEAKGEVLKNNKNRPVKVIGTIQDLTKLKTIKRELEKKNEQLKAAQRITKLGSCEYNVDTKKFACTEELADIFETSYDEVKEFEKEFFLSITDASDRQALEQHLDKAIEEKGAFEFFHNLINKKGHLKKVHTIGTYIYDDISKTDRLIVTVQDVTTLESLKELNLLKDQFIGMASHELKNPLASVMGYMSVLELMISQGKTDIAPIVTRVSHQLSRMKVLIDSLLDLNMIQTGNIKYDMQKVEFCSLLQEWKQDFQLIHPDVNITIKGTFECEIVADKYRLEQVLTNLASNAAKYSPDVKEVAITVHDLTNELKIDVADKGIGISKDDLKKLFKKFSRSASVTKKFKGLGLGLFITKEIIRRHGGDISVTSEEGKGSVFSFTLPKHQQAGDES